MGGLREGLSQAQWLRPNWLGMETAGNLQKGSHNEVFSQTLLRPLRLSGTFFIMLKVKRFACLLMFLSQS